MITVNVTISDQNTQSIHNQVTAWVDVGN